MAENIVITGGELFNKGAQAMVFTVVSELKDRYPDKNIYLLSTPDYQRSAEEKEKYNFNFLPWTDSHLELSSLKIFKIFTEKKIKKFNNKVKKEIIDVLKNTDFVVDINGYCLSSQLSRFKTIRYLANINIFKKFGIDMYILPQSLGPFNYDFTEKIIFYPLLYKYLKYPKIIFAREKHGFNSIKKFANNNLEKSVDIVLQRKELKIKNVFTDSFNVKKMTVEDNSVGIIPNQRLLSFNKGNNVLEIYNEIIKYVLKLNKKVYILRHSSQDLDLCTKINNLFKEESRVKLIKEELNAIELENIIKQFDYIIGARYHSIVHAYRNNVPALIIGWAVKYKELAQFFEQTSYTVDIRNRLNIDKVKELVNILNQNYSKESSVIKNILSSLQEESVFNELIINQEETNER